MCRSRAVSVRCLILHWKPATGGGVVPPIEWPSKYTIEELIVFSSSSEAWRHQAMMGWMSLEGRPALDVIIGRQYRLRNGQAYCIRHCRILSIKNHKKKIHFRELSSKNPVDSVGTTAAVKSKKFRFQHNVKHTLRKTQASKHARLIETASIQPNDWFIVVFHVGIDNFFVLILENFFEFFLSKETSNFRMDFEYVTVLLHFWIFAKICSVTKIFPKTLTNKKFIMQKVTE